MAQLAKKHRGPLQPKPSTATEFLFHYAVMENNVSMVKSLLGSTDLKLNKAGEDGFYPLHLAAASGSLDCVEYLVQAGADVNVSLNGISPLDLAVLEGEFDCARFLIQCGANIQSIRNGFSNINFLCAIKDPIF